MHTMDLKLNEIREDSVIINLHPNELQVVPHFLQQIVEVPFMMGRDRYAMRNLINNIQFFYTNLICKKFLFENISYIAQTYCLNF